ncbi:hypothetical protein Tco_0183983 [Tanacetum coccineum]
MLANRRYPLTRETLKRMMELKLTVESEGEAVFDLLRFIRKQIDEFGGLDGNIKNWLVQKQTDFGKYFSNPFMADSLPKTIWFSTLHASHAPCYSNEALAIPEQMATGKEISNSFMTGRASLVQAIECLDTSGFTSWIEAIMLFLAYASFMDFTVYQMDVKSAFLYGTIEKEDKYVYDILKKFGFSSIKRASTPMETHKPLSKGVDGTDVDVHLYRSMIGSLMYLTSSRPDIMFPVCACSRFQVQPKASHMYTVKRIFRYVKGQPTLGLWYPKDLPLDLIAYSDSDYAGDSLDRKSTTGGYQLLGCRLISWQYKKQTIIANSTTEAEYIAASNCCG